MLRKAVFCASLFVLFTAGTYLATEHARTSLHGRSSPADKVQNETAGRITKEGKTEPSSLGSKTKSQLPNPLPGQSKIAVKLDTNDTKSTINNTATDDSTTQQSIHNTTNTTITTSNVSLPNVTISTTNKVTRTSADTTTQSPSLNTESASTASVATSTSREKKTSSMTQPNIETNTESTTQVLTGAQKTASTTQQQLSTTTINGTVNSTLNGTLVGSESAVKGLSPILATVVAVGCGLVLIVVIFVAIKIFKNVKTFRFSRLHEMPMDDFDDYSGVYAEHTVPIRPL